MISEDAPPILGVFVFRRLRDLARVLLIAKPFLPGAVPVLKRKALRRDRRKAPDTDPFENVTEEEIISLWQSFKSAGLTADEAWHAIVTGIALDMAFARSQGLRRLEQ